MEYKTIKLNNEAVNVDDRIFKGYASIFGNIDYGNDITEQGAFEKTLKERKDKVKVMYNHYEMIGKPKVLEETEKGLWVEGYVSRTSRGDDILTLMKDGAISEMSFAYDVVKYEMDDIKGREVRRLKELKLWEVSVVDFAMNEAAEITAVKSIAEKRGIILSDEQIKQLIKSFQSFEPGNPLETTEPGNPLPDDVMSIINRIEEKNNIFMVRRKLNGR